MSASDTSPLARLRRLLEEAPGLSPADVEHFLPYLVVSAVARAGAVTLSHEVVRIIGSVAAAAGAGEDDTPAEIRAKLDAYYRKRPPHPEAVRVFAAWAREEVAAGRELPDVGAVAKFAEGSHLKNFRGDLGSSERPAGTTRGQMARLDPGKKKR